MVTQPSNKKKFNKNIEQLREANNYHFTEFQSDVAAKGVIIWSLKYHNGKKKKKVFGK